MSTTDQQINETITSLQNHIVHLTNLVERVNTVRKIPGLLLAPSTLTGSQLEQGFEQINELKDAIGRPVTQDCLKLAHESFSKNSENVGLEGRRQIRKRRYVIALFIIHAPVHTWHRRPPSPIPDSPRPPPALPKHIFPPSSRSSSLSASELASYLREYNKIDETLKLHIWTPIRPKPQENVSHMDLSSQSREIILRISIRDVLYAYARLDVIDCSPIPRESNRTEDTSRLVVESVTVFGPRERVCHLLHILIAYV